MILLLQIARVLGFLWDFVGFTELAASIFLNASALSSPGTWHRFLQHIITQRNTCGVLEVQPNLWDVIGYNGRIPSKGDKPQWFLWGKWIGQIFDDDDAGAAGAAGAGGGGDADDDYDYDYYYYFVIIIMFLLSLFLVLLLIINNMLISSWSPKRNPKWLYGQFFHGAGGFWYLLETLKETQNDCMVNCSMGPGRFWYLLETL